MTQQPELLSDESELLTEAGVLNRTFSVRRTAGKWVAGMGVIALLTVYSTTSPYYVNIWTSALLFAGMATAWNILGGFGGQFSLGNSVFFGIGAYSALFLTSEGYGSWLPILVGVVLSGLVAWGIAAPLFRLRGHFFVISTLALTVAAASLATSLDWLGGPNGIGIPFSDAIFSDPTAYVWLMLGFVALATAIATYIKHTRLGYSLFAVRDDEEGARAAGINPLVTKTQAFLVSACLTGLGGGLFANFVGFIDPHTGFDVQQVGVQLPLLALIGGIGTIHGPVIGALLMQPLSDILRGEFGGRIPGLDVIIFAAILLVAALFFRRGIAGTFSRLQSLATARWRTK